MRKIMLIVLIVAAMIGCKKENLSFEGTRWSRVSGEYTITLDFYSSSSFKSVSAKTSNMEVISTMTGSYSEENGTAYMEFSTQGLADQEATISGSSLTVKNLSTGKSFVYGKE